MTRKNDNQLITLQAYAENFDYKYLRDDNDSITINNGRQTYVDIPRCGYIRINGNSISNDFISELNEKYKYLIQKDDNGEEKNYRMCVREVFREMFKHAEAPIPKTHILEELITSCNQSGYEYGSGVLCAHIMETYNLAANVDVKGVDIYCIDSNSLSIQYKDQVISVKDPQVSEKVCDILYSLEFTLQSHEDNITYKDCKLSFTFPCKELQNYLTNNQHNNDQHKRGLLELLTEFCEWIIRKVFGQSSSVNVVQTHNIEITHNLDDTCTITANVNSTLTDIVPVSKIGNCQVIS